MNKILIIANARRLPGMSGSDSIYLNFAKYWKDVEVWDMLKIDFKPFTLCYIYRIILGCLKALFCQKRYEFVYSASDFWMDSIPAAIIKFKSWLMWPIRSAFYTPGKDNTDHIIRWVAGFYLDAPKDKPIYSWTQKPIRWLINKFADVVCVTNETMADGFKGKKIIPVYGGVDLTLAYPDNTEKIYDAVFVGRLHYTKGITELMEIWDKVLMFNHNAQLAVIGGSDTEEEKFKRWTEKRKNNVQWYGFMGDERFNIYRKSRVVLYPTPYEYSHFSMGPVEAMACGCPMIAFNLSVMKTLNPKGVILCQNIKYFVKAILTEVLPYQPREAIEFSKIWDWKITARRVYEDISNGK